MKNWVIKKQQRPDSTPSFESESKAKTVGSVISVLALQDSCDVIITNEHTASLPLYPIEEEPEADEETSDEPHDDHTLSFEFDLLENTTSLGLMDTNNQVIPYVTFKSPLGSVHSVASPLQYPTSNMTFQNYQLIVDSGCTCHMFPFRDAFISYKETPSSYVILADKSQVPCIGLGVVSFSLSGKSIVLHDVLHVPSLPSPLLLVQCFHHLNGCSFLADNMGCFLSFPQFFLPVDDTSDWGSPSTTSCC
jgi:hypothetical protein